MSDTGQRSRNNLIFFGLLAVVLLVYLYVLRPLNRGLQGGKHPAIGAAMPKVPLDPLDPKDKPLTSDDLTGKVVLVNFWATWCGPCQQEFPHLVAIEKKFRSNPKFAMLSIASPGQGETEDDMRASTTAFLQQRNVDMPVYLDPYSIAYQAVMRATAARGGIPLTLVVDQTGIIRGMWEGYAPGTENEVEESIASLLSG